MIKHEESANAQSIRTETEDVESVDHVRKPRNRRRATRVDYKALHKGTDQSLTEGNTEISAHVATDNHKKEDFEIEAIDYEQDWYRRGVKEAIQIIIQKSM